MNNDILVADDEINIISVVKAYLEKSGYNVRTATTGRQVLEQFERTLPALVILDLMLPDMPGEKVCETIKRRSGTPVILLTAKAKEEDILNGFDIGADDYVTKPFSPKLLAARVTALLRRYPEPSGMSEGLIAFGNGSLTIDTSGHEVKKDGKTVKLTPNEYRLLLTLISHPGRVFTRRELIMAALGGRDESERVVDTHVKNLRHKIESVSGEPRYILTVNRMGYRFGCEEQ